MYGSFGMSSSVQGGRVTTAAGIITDSSLMGHDPLNSLSTGRGSTGGVRQIKPTRNFVPTSSFKSAAQRQYLSLMGGRTVTNSQRGQPIMKQAENLDSEREVVYK